MRMVCVQVWAKVHGHPIWPGQVLRDLFAPDNVVAQKPQQPGAVLLIFFGDGSYGCVCVCWEAGGTLLCGQCGCMGMRAG